MAYHGMAWDVMGWHGMSWDVKIWDGMGWHGMVCFVHRVAFEFLERKISFGARYRVVYQMTILIKTSCSSTVVLLVLLVLDYYCTISSIYLHPKTGDTHRNTYTRELAYVKYIPPPRPPPKTK